MTPALAVVLFALGSVGAFVAGLLGVGGALIMLPLLLYVPPLLGVGGLDVKSVAAITMVQVFVAALSGVAAHRRYKAVDSDLAWVGGTAMAVASFVGALGSKYVADRWLLLVFALMVTTAAPLLVLPVDAIALPMPAGLDDGAARFSRVRILVVAGTVGVAAGLVGAGGAFLLVPLLLVVVRVPIRVTIGSSLAITAMAAAAGFAGKLVTGQIPLGPAVVVALGALPAAQVGATVSRRLDATQLRALLFMIVIATGLRVWWDVLVQ